MLTPQTSPGRAPAAKEEQHGGRIRLARLLFPNAPEPFIDLSTGINPHSYSLPELSPSAWTRLPEPEDIAALEVTAARAYGVGDGTMVAALPGTQILISLLPSLFPGRAAAILAPTYAEYAQTFALAGCETSEAASLSDMAEADRAVLVNPNNPDGRRFKAIELLTLLKARNGKGLLIVDESFADFEEKDLSLAPHLPQPGLLLLRSLSKSYGLGGLRLGFALAAPEVAAAIRASLGPWPVSGPAIEIGITALSDQAWLAASKERLAADAARLDAILSAAQLAPLGGTLLFRLAASDKAASIFARLGEAGILVRRFDRHPDWLRFGIPGDGGAWERLAAALRA